MRSHSKTMDEARAKAQTLTMAGVAKNIRCPIFIVAGKLDRLTPYTNAERLKAEVAGPCRYLLVEDGNHVVNNRRYTYTSRIADWTANELGLPQT